ncbi:predicted protein [Lichtheimia corymbifera JMRC:FSU:9682]|uniref:Uncharacterized protein n=1 Tax=Lichtheimia corymbifera JMRC:FSU:9682 TaxID=1263082 RepID=A0A068S639_9FUNG|nr:predicted protein [Lichtheimia corymbifera JMRC:FSU:9682]
MLVDAIIADAYPMTTSNNDEQLTCIQLPLLQSYTFTSCLAGGTTITMALYSKVKKVDYDHYITRPSLECL